MTKPSVHAILADLHKLLSTYRSVDFVDASNYVGIPRPMREALRALAQEAPSVVDGSSRNMDAAASKPRSDRKRAKKPHGESPNLLDLIHRSQYFKSTASMVNYADSIGVKFSVRPKESRERVARRLASLINELPDSKKAQIARELFNGKNSQTQGWIEVIKNRNQ